MDAGGNAYAMSRKTPLVTMEPGTDLSYDQLGFQSVRTAAANRQFAVGGSGRRHMTYDRTLLIDQSRKLKRDNGIYGGMIERAVDYIVGAGGFSLRARTGAKGFNRKVEQLWKDYWKRPDVTLRLAGWQVERMICRELLTCGDVGTVKTTDEGRVQIIEAEQIVGKGRFHNDGMVCKQNGRATGYWVSGYGAGGQLDRKNARRIEPKNFIFVVDPDRPSSRRGFPPAQASFAMLHRINDVCDSEAIAWQLLARMALSIQQGEAERNAWNDSNPDPNAKGTETALRVQEIGYALMWHAPPGSEIKGIDRNIPGKDFTNSITMFLRLMGLPLGLPLEIILLDWTKSNYSQSRAVLEQAYQRFQAMQMLQATFLDDVYEWRVAQWIASGELSDRADATKHDWITQAFPWLDKLKEAQAYGLQVDRTFTTHGQVCKSLRRDRADVVAEHEAEVREAIEIAQKIENDTGQKVDWQMFAGHLPPKATVTATAEKPEMDQDDDDDEEKTS